MPAACARPSMSAPAEASRSVATTCGSAVTSATPRTAQPMPSTAPATASSAALNRPAAAAAHSARAAVAEAASAAIITRRRSKRSASQPAGICAAVNAPSVMEAITPVSAGEPVAAITHSM